MRGGIKRYWGYLQEAVEGAYHAKHLEKGETQKDSRGWGAVWWPKEKKVPDLTHLAPPILVRKRPT